MAALTLDVAETLTLAEARTVSFAKNFNGESLAVAETVARVSQFSRNFAESFSTADSARSSYSLSFASSIGVNEQIVRASNAVVSDLSFMAQEFTRADFIGLFQSGSAVGYEAFRFAVVGEYDYQKALFKSVLSSTSGSSPRITKMQVEVDVPDVFDKGTATTSTSGPVTVFFNRPFYRVDEVICTLKGGTELGTPRVTPIDGFSFQLELYNSSNVRIAGTVSWSAKGY